MDLLHLLINMIDMINRQISKLKVGKVSSEWDNYYDNTNYDDLSDKSKIKYVSKDQDMILVGVMEILIILVLLNFKIILN